MAENSFYQSEMSPEYAATLRQVEGLRNAQMQGYRAMQEASIIDASKAKAAAKQSLDEQYLAIPEGIRNGMYPGIETDRQAALNRLEFNHQIALINQNDPGASVLMEKAKSMYPEDTRKDFKDTSAYKFAQQETHAFQERKNIAGMLGDQLDRMRDALEKGDKQLAINIGKTGVMKTTNSLVSKDAVGASEQNTRYQDLLSLPDVLITTPGQTLASALFNKMVMAKQKLGTNSKEFKDANSQWTSLIENTIEADPERFFKTAYELHDAAATTVGDSINRIVDMTSPYHAQALGAIPVRRIQPFRDQSNQQQTSNQYIQTAPSATMTTGAGTAVPVSSGSTQMTVPQSAPNSIEQEMKKRGLIK